MSVLLEHLTNFMTVRAPNTVMYSKKNLKNGVFCDQCRVGHKMRLQNVNNIKHNQEITSKSIPFVFSPSYWNI